MIMMEIVLNFYDSPDEDKKPFGENEKWYDILPSTHYVS